MVLAAYYGRSTDQLTEGEVRTCCICVMSVASRHLRTPPRRHPVSLCPYAGPRLVPVLKNESPPTQPPTPAGRPLRCRGARNSLPRKEPCPRAALLLMPAACASARLQRSSSGHRQEQQRALGAAAAATSTDEHRRWRQDGSGPTQSGDERKQATSLGRFLEPTLGAPSDPYVPEQHLWWW